MSITRDSSINTIKRKICLFFVIFSLLILLVNCHAKPVYLENPYFTDETENTFVEFKKAYQQYLTKLDEYYDSQYAVPSPFLSLKQAIESSNDYIPIYYQNTMRKEDLSINHHLINEIQSFHSSTLYFFINSYHMDFENGLLAEEGCQENVPCENDQGERIHFSMNQKELYMSYQHHEYVSESLISLDGENKLHVEFTQALKFEDELYALSYLSFEEGIAEYAMAYNNLNYTNKEFSIYQHDIHSGEAITLNLHQDHLYRITYYNKSNNQEFVTYFGPERVIETTNFNQYIDQRLSFSINNQFTKAHIRLNDLEGWNMLTRIVEEGISLLDYEVSMNGILLDSGFHVEIIPYLGAVYYEPTLDFDLGRIPEDLITLGRYGLYTGFDDEKLNQIFSDYHTGLNQLLIRFNLNMNDNELKDIILDKMIDYYNLK